MFINNKNSMRLNIKHVLARDLFTSSGFSIILAAIIDDTLTRARHTSFIWRRRFTIGRQWGIR